MTIRELKAQGKSIRQIAAMTGYSRNTVRKYLRAKGLPERKQPPLRPSKLDPFKAYLRTRIAEGVLNCEVLLREIRQLGYEGGRSILKEFVKPLRLPRQPRAVMRYEVLPGEQAQVDWAEFSYLDEQKHKRKVHAFVMLLSYSRDMYVEFVERVNLSTFLRCHVHAFEHFGGVPRTILYDNAKVVRLGTDVDGRPVFNPRLLDFALVCGFEPRLCRPYRAQTKGRVERAIRYVKDNFWPGRKFTSLTDLNQQALAWCAQVAQRTHGTTNRRPCDMRQEEALQPFSGKAAVLPYLGEERMVGRDGFVKYNGCRYGVPWAYAQQVVEVREVGYHIEILHNGRVIAVHPRALLPGITVPLNGQWDGLWLDSSSRPVRKPVAYHVPTLDVEVRPLSVYGALAEVTTGA